MEEEWALALRDQSDDADVKFFFKQWGGRTGKAEWGRGRAGRKDVAGDAGSGADKLR